jgi:hypothetical protein
VVISFRAQAHYTQLHLKVGPDLTLGILKELLAMCNSTEGKSFYRDFFRPVIETLFPKGTIVEWTGEGNKIQQLDAVDGKLVIN